MSIENLYQKFAKMVEKINTSGVDAAANDFRQNQNKENAQKMINCFYKLGRNWDGAENAIKEWQKSLPEDDILKTISLIDLVKIRDSEELKTFQEKRQELRSQIKSQPIEPIIQQAPVSEQTTPNEQITPSKKPIHLESLKKQTFNKNAEHAVTIDVLGDDAFSLIRCTQNEAMRRIANNEVYDKSGKRIIYYITDTKGFSMSKSKKPTEKEFIAYHGTGANKDNSDYQVTSSGLSTLAKSMNSAFMIAHNGAIIQFFDPRQGYGALSGRAYKLGYGDINRHTIAVEIALREDRKSQYGVEDPKIDQINAAHDLNEYLKKTYHIDDNNVITSADPVKKNGQFVRGAHVDDFSPEVRAAIGIASNDEALRRLIAYRETWRDNAA